MKERLSMNEIRFPPNDAREWLNRAKSNLAQEKTKTEGIYLEDLCFNAQQCAEKAIKALLIELGLKFPYTHNVTELLTLVEKSGQKIPEEIKRAGILSDYAVESRYPGIFEPVTEEEYQEAVTIAGNVVRWVDEYISKRKKQ